MKTISQSPAYHNYTSAMIRCFYEASAIVTLWLAIILAKKGKR